MYSDYTDEKLIAILKEDDALALEALFNRYYKTLCHVSAVYTKDYTVSEEVIANLFIKLWDSREILAILNVKNYLLISAKNLSLNYNQKRKDPVVSFEDVDMQTETFRERDNPFKILSGRESYNKILSMIDTLPASQREVVLLSRVDNLDKHKISLMLGISVRTVETTLYQSIKKLRALLKNTHDLTSGS